MFNAAAAAIAGMARLGVPTFAAKRRVHADIGYPVKRGHTTAHGKRAAAKARNVKRHKAAMRRAA
jgi:hypothetical protein